MKYHEIDIKHDSSVRNNTSSGPVKMLPQNFPNIPWKGCLLWDEQWDETSMSEMVSKQDAFPASVVFCHKSTKNNCIIDTVSDFYGFPREINTETELV